MSVRILILHAWVVTLKPWHAGCQLKISLVFLLVFSPGVWVICVLLDVLAVKFFLVGVELRLYTLWIFRKVLAQVEIIILVLMERLLELWG